MMSEALMIPNLTHPEVPIGDEPKVLAQKGTIPSEEPKDHLEIGRLHDLFDFEGGSKITGSKFVFLKNEAVFLELGLVYWALDRIRKKGYQLKTTPDLARTDIAAGCGFQPRDPSGQMYSVEEDLCLVGTSEITLAGLHSEEVLDPSTLPLKYGGFSHCFRKEAGKGTSAKGLYRLHQFSKVEMFAFCNQSTSEELHHEMLGIQTELMEELELPYRVLDMPTTDLGNSAFRKFDIEVYLPSKKDYGEVTSTSNCLNYQSVRLNAYYQEGSVKKHLHTVNGTALAVPRIMMALLELGQKSDGSVEFPKVLHSFLPFTQLSPK